MTVRVLCVLILSAAGLPAAAQPVGSQAPRGSAAEALAAAPKVQISNGLVAAEVLLPDRTKGFYRGVRFDWGGMVSSLKYRGQEYYGLWFDRIAPDVRDYVFRDGGIDAAPNTAALGPVDAYDPSQPIGWDEAAPGGAFLKIGVGLLRKPADGAAYSSYRNYEWANPGEWKVSSRRDGVTFTHTVSDAASGYGYVYRKELRLLRGKPALEIRHSLTNTGSQPLSTTTFNHNFLTLGGRPAREGLEIGATFPIQAGRPLRDVAQVEGERLVYRRVLGAEEIFSTPITSAAGGPMPYDVHVRDARGTGFRVQGDRPMSSLQLWSMPATVSLEPFVTLQIAPGETADWTFAYTYTAPADR